LVNTWATIDPLEVNPNKGKHAAPVPIEDVDK
jgi:hypothetical protein